MESRLKRMDPTRDPYRQQPHSLLISVNYFVGLGGRHFQQAVFHQST